MPGFGVLGGSWVVIRGITILIIHIRGLITPLIATHQRPSKGLGFRGLGLKLQLSENPKP